MKPKKIVPLYLSLQSAVRNVNQFFNIYFLARAINYINAERQNWLNFCFV